MDLNDSTMKGWVQSHEVHVKFIKMAMGQVFL